jgi:O-antigen/teichoic acid export membrane protein
MGLQARDRTRDVFLGQAASALTTLVGSLVLGLWFGLVGFAITFWLATIARLAVVVALYRSSIRYESQSP